MEEGSTGLSFEERGIARALNDRVLRVPLNQRSYAWSGDEVQELLDDLYAAFEGGDEIYFLGTVVLTRGNSQWEISDGQQRLATTSIMVAAVRDYLLELGDEDGARKYQESYLLDYNVRQKDFTPKLYLNYEDHDFFVNRILKSPRDRTEFKGQPFASHDRLLRAAELAASHLRKIAAPRPDNEKASRLYDWIDYLHSAAKVIIIMVPGRVGNTFKMFETLNARGAEASKTDILKNYLFDVAKNRIGDIHPRWIGMISTIEGVGEDELLIRFIRHHWISQHGPITERELGTAIENAVRGERQAVDLVMSLSSGASDYVALLSPRDHPRWAEFSRAARDAIYTISRELGGEQIRPLMLAVARSFAVKEAEKAFQLMVSWSVRFLIAGGGGGGVLDKTYGTCAKEVAGGEIKTAKQLRARMADVVPNDEVFRRAFAIASVRRTALARYYLRALELHVKDEKQPQLLPNDDTQAVNLEHVLPINPSGKWEIASEVAAAYYRRLGNMVLLNAKQNADIGNGEFTQKRPVMQKSPFVLTVEAARPKKWGPEQIEKRQEQLAELAPSVWPI